MALPVLLRKDSGFDSAKLLFTVAPGKDHWATMDRRFVFLGQMEPNTSEQSLLGWDIGIGRRMCWKAGGETGNVYWHSEWSATGTRKPVRSGLWTSQEAEETVIERYRDHGSYEQFYSEIKTGLDLEYLGAFDNWGSLPVSDTVGRG